MWCNRLWSVRKGFQKYTVWSFVTFKKFFKCLYYRILVIVFSHLEYTILKILLCINHTYLWKWGMGKFYEKMGKYLVAIREKEVWLMWQHWYRILHSTFHHVNSDLQSQSSFTQERSQNWSVDIERVCTKNSSHLLYYYVERHYPCLLYTSRCV